MLLDGAVILRIFGVARKIKVLKARCRARRGRPAFHAAFQAPAEGCGQDEEGCRGNGYDTSTVLLVKKRQHTTTEKEPTWKFLRWPPPPPPTAIVRKGENAAMSSKPVKRSELLNCFKHTPFEQQFSSQNEHY